MHQLLDFFARTYTPNIHACGQHGTRLLLSCLQPKSGQRILEIGFGTGHSLVEVAAKAPGALLFGLEKSPIMLEAAEKRLRFSGVKNIQLTLFERRFPFGNDFFDSVYCESVLAIVPDDKLPGYFAEIFRVLKPGGRFCCNESLWLESVEAGLIEAINSQCLAAFGIVQASGRYAFPSEWAVLGAQAGLQFIRMEDIGKDKLVGETRLHRALLMSKLFSRLGWLKARVVPELVKYRRSWRKAEKMFAAYGTYLRGHLFEFQKPG